MGDRENIEKATAEIVSRRVTTQEHSASRREFFARIPGAAAVTLASATVPVISPADATGAKGSPGAANKRAADSFQIRLDAAQEEAKVSTPRQIANGDEQKYPNFIGNYHKGCRRTRSARSLPPPIKRFCMQCTRAHLIESRKNN